jgi:hypothetical protein
VLAGHVIDIHVTNQLAGVYYLLFIIRFVLLGHLSQYGVPLLGHLGHQPIRITSKQIFVTEIKKRSHRKKNEAPTGAAAACHLFVKLRPVVPAAPTGGSPHPDTCSPGQYLPAPQHLKLPPSLPLT